MDRFKLFEFLFNLEKIYILDLILVVMTIIDTVREVSEEKLSYTAPNVVIVSGLINAVSYETCPEEKASILNLLYFWWMNSFLIAYSDDRENKPSWKGYLPAIGLFVSGMIQSVFYHQNYKLGMAVGMRVRCSLISAIYKKSLTMNSDAKKETMLGQIVSLMSVDCQHLQDMFTYLSTVMSVPVQVAIGMYLLWGTLGISCLAGLGVLLLLIPLNSFVAARQLTLTADVLALKGERIKLMNQILNGMKGKVSLKRVGNFLCSEDLDPSSIQHVFDTEYAIKIQRGTFTWDKENPQSTLRDINLTIPDGQLVAVVGHVGAGKSSLFSATLGEMLKIDGSVAIKKVSVEKKVVSLLLFVFYDGDSSLTKLSGTILMFEIKR
ncbi:ABCC1 [Mytilus coruscus]|uniref:ABCC1 n=1 Tax=Mytilus coruscus TaxID=42192 RepID=A0A6J8CBS4_MYTCO|nr:ABCC1 [Mytilus coruscus]